MKFIIYEKSREEYQVSWTGAPMILGRRSDADIQINEPTMSGTHARIFPAGDGVRIRDLESLNGTLVNGLRITETEIRPGDQIRIGRVTIVVSGPVRGASGVGQSDPPTPTVSEDSVGQLADTHEPAPLEDPNREARPAATRLAKTRVAKARLGAAGGQAAAKNHLATQTVKVSLFDLSSERLEEDDHILLLRNLFEALESATDRRDVLGKVREVLKKAFGKARVFVLEPSEGGEWLDPEARNVDRRPSQTFAEEAARTLSAILSTSLPEDERFAESDSVRIAGIATAIAAPTSCEGTPVAVLYVDRLVLPSFSRRDLNVLGIAANHVTAVLENVSRIDALRRANAELLETRESLAELNRNLEQLVEDRTAEIQRQADEIADLAEAKDELLGIAAHDIRGPLTVIQGTTELLRLRFGKHDEGTLSRSLDLMHDACRGLNRLLGELLDAKAIESGKITLRKLRYPVGRLIEDSLPVARLAADDKGVELVVEVDRDLAIDADPQRLTQAITNLVLNAVKFSPSGTRILLRGVAGANGLALIEVEDQGIGIPEKELEAIFGTFEQGEAGRQYGGSGLGLMIARRIVELHGGSLAVKSTVGVGTRFTLTLPVADAEQIAARS